MNEHGTTRTLALAPPDWTSIGFDRLRLTVFRIDTPAFGLFGLVLERGDRAQGFLALRDGSARQANYGLTGEAAQTAQLIYVHSDHLSTPRLATDDTQAVLWRWQGLAFGNTAAREDPDGDGIKTAFNLRFPGQYHDTESGLYYNWNRYYDPGKGRYVTSDPIGLFGGLNTYSYVANNPLRFIDPLALESPIDDGGFAGPPTPPGSPPSACSYYDRQCEANKCDEYACGAGDCCRSFGDNIFSNCTRACLIRWDKGTCVGLTGVARSRCRLLSHYVCYARCGNVPDLFSAPWLRPQCQAVLNNLQ